jgi:hypothetical protein
MYIDGFDPLISPQIYDPEADEHECDSDSEPDCDICAGCRDHATFCSICGLSNCCGENVICVDRDIDMER